MRRSLCPICQRRMATFAGGDFRVHGPQSRPCLGSRRTPSQAERYILSPLNDRQSTMFRQCWSSGDWRPVELEFGIVCPQYTLIASTPEGELAELICDVRNWLELLVELSICHAAQRVW